MVLLPFKQTSQLSPKLIIVAQGVNTNNGWYEILLLHFVANSALKNNRRGNIRSCENFQNLVIILYNNGVVAMQACLITLSKAHHCFPGCQCQQWRACDAIASHGRQFSTQR